MATKHTGPEQPDSEACESVPRTLEREHLERKFDALWELGFCHSAPMAPTFVDDCYNSIQCITPHEASGRDILDTDLGYICQMDMSTRCSAEHGLYRCAFLSKLHQECDRFTAPISGGISSVPSLLITCTALAY